MKIPYAMTAAVDIPTRHDHMRQAIAVANERGYARLAKATHPGNRTLAIACYGPSLKQTWEALKGKTILSMSGATHFLVERGIIPTMHMDMDPRVHKVHHLSPLVDDVLYLMASVCPPETWQILEPLPQNRVTLWHLYSGKDPDGLDTNQFVKVEDPGAMVVRGGSTIGISAIHVGLALGFTRFEIHGMDGSFADGQRHAGPHYGKPQNDGYTWKAEGHTYQTSKIMANAVAETLNLCKNWPIKTVFHGDGLTQALIREMNAPNAATANQSEKAAQLLGTEVRPAPKGPTWDDIAGTPDPEWLVDLQAIWADSETRRIRSKFNTGSIPMETGLMLRGICRWKQPKIIAEVGTFVGKSTRAMTSDYIFTCDLSNDCLDPTDRIYTYPYRTSTYMFQDLVEQKVPVDLFFFDGRLVDEDLPLIAQLAQPDAVYAFDDYHPGGKGEANVAKLLPQLKSYAFVSPNPSYSGRSTLALLVPCK